MYKYNTTKCFGLLNQLKNSYKTPLQGQDYTRLHSVDYSNAARRLIISHKQKPNLGTCSLAYSDPYKQQ